MPPRRKKPAPRAPQPPQPRRPRAFTLRDYLIWGGSGSAALTAMLILIVYVFTPVRNILNSDPPPYVGLERFLPVRDAQVRFMMRLESFDEAQKQREICETKRNYDAYVDRQRAIELRLRAGPDAFAQQTLDELVRPRVEALQRSLLSVDASRC